MTKNTELLGVKVKVATKEQISKLIEQAKEAGIIEYNGDIFDLLVERFQQDELAKKMSYGADLKELQQITKRINDIFINQAERNETNLGDLKNSHNEVLLELQEELNEFKEKKKELQVLLTEKDNKYNELTDLYKVNQDRIKELEDVQSSFQERIKEQKLIIDEKEEKIVAKNELISEKEEAVLTMKKDIALNGDLKKKIDSLQSEISRLNQTISSKEDDLKKQKENLEFECQKRLFDREQELNREKENEIQKVRDQLTSESKHYQEKYEKSLEEKEKLRSANYELKATLDREQMNMEYKDKVIAELTAKIEGLENVIKEGKEKN